MLVFKIFNKLCFIKVYYGCNIYIYIYNMDHFLIKGLNIYNIAKWCTCDIYKIHYVCKYM